MEHSKKFDTVNKYYHTYYNGVRMWDIKRVSDAVVKCWITAEEFKEITGQSFDMTSEVQ